jgi:hypothetical protein
MNFEIKTSEGPLSDEEVAKFVIDATGTTAVLLGAVPNAMKKKINIAAAEHLACHIHDERVSLFDLPQCSAEKRHKKLESYRDKLARALSGEPIESIFPPKSPMPGPLAGVRATLFRPGLQSKEVNKSLVGKRKKDFLLYMRNASSRFS